MATETQTTPEQRAALRARYTPDPIPTCVHCGGPMQPADLSAAPGRPIYECPAALAECLANPTGSAFHLIDGRRIVWRGDPAVLAALDDLEATSAGAERLRTALAFYADPANWRLSKDAPGSPWVTAGDCWPDKGQRARAALGPQLGAGQEPGPDAPDSGSGARKPPQSATDTSPAVAGHPCAISGKAEGNSGDGR
jgi:hypothetical protein